jgi:hypothetical protein
MYAEYRPLLFDIQNSIFKNCLPVTTARAFYFKFGLNTKIP